MIVVPETGTTHSLLSRRLSDRGSTVSTSLGGDRAYWSRDASRLPGARLWTRSGECGDGERVGGRVHCAVSDPTQQCSLSCSCDRVRLSTVCDPFGGAAHFGGRSSLNFQASRSPARIRSPRLLTASVEGVEKVI